MVQVPTALPVTQKPSLPDVEQIPGISELNSTGLPEPLPVALTAPELPTMIDGATPKVMVWLHLGEQSMTLCGLPEALLVIVTEPTRAPAAVGVKVTLMLQNPAAPKPAPQLLV